MHQVKYVKRIGQFPVILCHDGIAYPDCYRVAYFL